MFKKRIPVCLCPVVVAIYNRQVIQKKLVSKVGQAFFMIISNYIRSHTINKLLALGVCFFLCLMSPGVEQRINEALLFFPPFYRSSK